MDSEHLPDAPVLGVDLGGTNARVALVAPDGTVLRAERRATAELARPEDLADWLATERAAWVAANPDSYLAVTQGPEGADDAEVDRRLRASRHTLDRLIDAGAFGAPRPAQFYVLGVTWQGRRHLAAHEGAGQHADAAGRGAVAEQPQVADGDLASVTRPRG